MPTPNPSLEPFVGYRVTLAPDAGTSSLPRLAPLHPAVRALLDGQRTTTLSLREADALYDAAESVSGGLGEPFPVRFTPVRCKRGRALPFETVALGAEEILHLVHDGFFGSALPRGSNRRGPGLRRSTDANACLAASAAPRLTHTRRGSG